LTSISRLVMDRMSISKSTYIMFSFVVPCFCFSCCSWLPGFVCCLCVLVFVL
jgi:hypothetical protein